MGSRLIEYGLTGGGTVVIEVDDPLTGNHPVSRGVADKARESFEAAIAQVKPGVEVLIAQLSDLTSKPDDVSLEFGIKFTAGADAVIAKTSVEGNIKATLAWKSKA